MSLELHDIIQTEGPERRVDSHKLVIFLSQMQSSVRELKDHQRTMSEALTKVSDDVEKLLQILEQGKGGRKALGLAVTFGASLATALMYIKDFIHF